MPPPTNQAPPYSSYGFPAMQPAYPQGPTSLTDSPASQDLLGSTGYQQYSQVWPLPSIKWIVKRVYELHGRIIATHSLVFLKPFPSLSQLSAALGGLSGVPELEVEALRPLNLLQERNLLPPRPLEAPEPNLSSELKKVNCSPQYVKSFHRFQKSVEENYHRMQMNFLFLSHVKDISMYPDQHPSNAGSAQQGQTAPWPPPSPLQRSRGGL